ncbi:MAG: ATP-binding protein [Anaeroplasmataceae bacterium]
MRLIKCYFYNFGIYSNTEVNLDNNITDIFYDNGKGKTTFSDFIKAMFYGLETTKKGSVTERSRYFPFNGGKFGGSLEFEFNKSIYRIERTFDKKSKTSDTLTVFKDNIKIDLADPLGIYFLKVDEETFNKVLFINSNEISSFKTNAIQSSINGYISDDTTNPVVDILTKLEKKMKSLDSASKQAIIPNLKKDIRELDIEINNLRSSTRMIDDVYKENIEILKELTNLEQLRDNYLKHKEKLNTKNRYLELKKELEDLKLRLDEYKSIYKNNIPFSINDLKELESLDRKIVEYNTIINSLNTIDNSIENDIFIYSNNEDRIKMIKTSTDKFNRCKEEISNISFNPIFKSKDKKELLDKVNTLYQQSSFIEDTPVANKKINPIKLILMCILIIPIIIYLLKSKTNKESNTKQDNNELVNMLTSYGFNSSNIHVNYSDFTKSINEEITKHEKLTKLDLDLTNIKEELDIRFSEFKIDNISNYTEKLDHLNKEFYKYNATLETKIKDKEKIDNAKNNLKLVEENLLTILTNYGISLKDYNANKIDFYKINISQINMLIDTLDQKEKILTNYFEKNKIDFELKDIYEGEDLDSINEKLNTYISYKNDSNRKIKELEEKQESLEEKLVEIKEKEEYLKTLTYDYKILTLTNTFLKQADEEVSNKYIKPVIEKFEKYKAIIKANLDVEVSIDRDFNIFIRKDGETKPFYHLSQGELSICAFCVRLALIDTLSETKAFIILDDPFIALDKQNITNTLSLVKKLSSEIQIIYLTCHDSRIINK